MRRILITVIVYCLFAWLLCDIDPNKCYSWLSGIWHGLFFIPNLIRSWFGDSIYKANHYITTYNGGGLHPLEAA